MWMKTVYIKIEPIMVFAVKVSRFLNCSAQKVFFKVAAITVLLTKRQYELKAI